VRIVQRAVRVRQRRRVALGGRCLAPRTRRDLCADLLRGGAAALEQISSPARAVRRQADREPFDFEPNDVAGVDDLPLAHQVEVWHHHGMEPLGAGPARHPITQISFTSVTGGSAPRSS
jgi:hypothetical protein